jgi:integrase/recombinase XerC
MSGVGGEGSDALERHLEWLQLKGLSASTVRRRRVVLGWVAASLDCTLLEASAGQLQAWRAALSVAPDAVSVYVSHVSQFYRWAVAQGLLGGSPAAALPAPRRARRLPRPIDEEGLALALAAAPPRIRPWLVLAGWAGLRAIEIARLRRENVLDTWAPPVLLIASDATKGHAERLVPLSRFVIRELQPVLPRRGWAFPRFDGRPGPNTPATVSHLANEHLHECGIAATLHQLRHRFATQAYQAAGGDLRLVQELLGHATPVSTAGYAAYDQAAAAAAVEAIPAPPRLRVCS